MKKLFSVFFIIIALVLFSSSCNQHGTDIPQDIGVIMPLAVGNTWTYKFIDYRKNTIDTISFQIIRDTIINKERWFFDLLGYCWHNREDGLYYKMDSNIYLKYPSKKGDLYNHYQGAKLIIDTNAPVEYFDLYTKVEEVHIPVSVLKGIFYCYQYNFCVGYEKGLEIPNSEAGIIWACPNVGFVKEVAFYVINDSIKIGWQMELIDYKLN